MDTGIAAHSGRFSFRIRSPLVRLSRLATASSRRRPPGCRWRLRRSLRLILPIASRAGRGEVLWECGGGSLVWLSFDHALVPPRRGPGSVEGLAASRPRKGTPIDPNAPACQPREQPTAPFGSLFLAPMSARLAEPNGLVRLPNGGPAIAQQARARPGRERPMVRPEVASSSGWGRVSTLSVRVCEYTVLRCG
jgi:hypothetical protein